MITVTIYYSNSSDGYENIIDILEELKPTLNHRVVKIDIERDPALKEAFKILPVLQIGPYRLEAPITEKEIEIAIRAAQERKTQLQTSGDENYKKRIERSKKLTDADRFGLWLSNHYMFLFNLVVAIYIGLPMLAPVLMNIGSTGPAKAIYTVYSPLCHQLAFRSFFLFGEQPFYPRELANVPGVLSYEQMTHQSAINILDARKFIGNDLMGYKIALCERDIAIYGSILIFGLIFALSQRKIKPLPWYIWIILGLFPIGLDGFSQLPGLVDGILPAWIIVRESTPLIRVITGALFGVTTAWYVYPILQETMLDTRRALIIKAEAVKQEI